MKGSTRNSASDAEWRAYQRVIAADLPSVDWMVSGSADATEERKARDDLAKEVAGLVVLVGAECTEALCAWQSAAAAEVIWREDSEAWRERLRVIMRAWREITDGMPAEVEGFGVLGSRLTFIEHGGQLWQQMWSPRALLTWLRLIRAGSKRKAANGAHGGNTAGGGTSRGTDATNSESEPVGRNEYTIDAQNDAQNDGRDAENKHSQEVDDNIAGFGTAEAAPSAGGPRSRRSDAILFLRHRARNGLRSYLSGTDGRTLHAQRARGDG